MIRFAETEPSYQPGQLVCHVRHGYRGVIVAVDLRCSASHEWYMSNRTQPDQNQPWYHVLVDGSATVNYAAQGNLEQDPTSEPVDHPLVMQFFRGMQDGRYVRNDCPWCGW